MFSFIPCDDTWIAYQRGIVPYTTLKIAKYFYELFLLILLISILWLHEDNEHVGVGCEKKVLVLGNQVGHFHLEVEMFKISGKNWQKW